MVKLLNNGTKVKTTIGEIEGIITGCSVRGLEVKYELSYFYQGEYRQCWISEFEFKITNGKRKQVGFRNK